MCPNGVTCLPVDCCFNDLALYNPIKGVGLVQREHHQNFIEYNLF